jgi:hypothetical protein
MEGSFGLEKIVASFLNRLPPLSRSRPRLVTSQPPFHFSWSSYVRG